MPSLNGKKVVVCDYPGKYLFPPNGYGGIERWLWTVAKESVKLGMEVLLLGPNWQHSLLPQAKYCKESIMDIGADCFLRRFGSFDFLVAGHEYWLNNELLKKFEVISDKSITYQHALNPQYEGEIFDNKKHFLFCYSDDFLFIFKKQKPTKLMCVSMGYDEEPLFRRPEGYLISIGRLDRDKSPHYAVLAAEKLGTPIYIIGESVRDSEYVKEYADVFNLPHVKKLGVVFGREKMECIARSLCGIYTIDSGYKEPAAGTICEIIKSGVPLVGMTWIGNDAVCEPFKVDNKLGRLERFNASKDDEEIVVDRLAGAIKESLNLDRGYIYEKGNTLYNSTKLVEKMFLRAFLC
jgi:glycosyltransferase involved in cell wall biosynthesis